MTTDYHLDRRRRSSCAGAAFGLAFCLAASSALAQDYQQVAPNLPKPEAPPVVSLPQSPAPPLPKGNRVIVPALKGLIFLDAPGKLQKNGVATRGVDVGGLTLLDRPEFRSAAASYIGKPLSFDTLNEIQRLVVAQYRKSDRPLVDVAVPEQNVNSGSIQLIVSEFRAGAVTAEGNEWFSSDQLTGAIRIKPGDPIRASTLIEDVNWLNENPFRQVDIVYRKDPQPDTTDIVLRTADRFPLRVYAGFDNSGTPLTGRDRWTLGFNWGDALGLGQIFSYQFTSSSDFWSGAPSGQRAPNFESHSVDWLIPLPWRDKIEIFGAYQQSVPRLGPDFGELGVSGQASIRYVAPLPALWGGAELIKAGYDFKTTNNNLAFGGATVSNIVTDIHQFIVIHDISFLDSLGRTELTNTLTLSPGNFGANNNNAAFNASQPFAKADYFYWNVALDRQTLLPLNLVWALHVQGQLADGNLLPSEQLGVGGIGSVRGYNLRIVNGDEGVVVSNELRWKPFRLLPEAYDDSLQLYVFVDYGSVHDITPPTNQPNGGALASVGPGLRYSIGRYLDLRADAGFQLRNAPGHRDAGALADLALTVSY